MRWDDIAALPMILREFSGDLTGYRAIVERIGAEPETCAFHMVSRATLAEMVAMDLGITVTFASAAPEQSGIVALPIKGKNALVAIEGIWAQEDHNPIRHRLLWHIRKAARKAPSE